MTPRTLSASSIDGTYVVNPSGEDLGHVKDLMINLQDGKVAYAVLSFGGFLGMGDKLFAIPFQTLELKKDEDKFILNIDKVRLEEAPGFDKDNWPSMANTAYWTSVQKYYSATATPAHRPEPYIQ